MPLLLVVIGIILIVLNYKALKKDENSFGSVLKYKKEDISEIEVQIGAIRIDMAESLTELQQDILTLKEGINFKEEDITKEESIEISNEVEEDERSFLLNTNQEIINDISKKSKTDRIKELLDLGYSDDEICEKLSLGKGEVLLVKRLFKK